VIPRKKIDIDWSDLAFAVRQCLFPANRHKVEQTLKENWSPENSPQQSDRLFCLSVRSGFDALLSALNFEPGDEILVSAITIHGMVRIITEHHLVTIPIDIDTDHLTPQLNAVDQAVSHRTKAILIAHLFGSRMPMEPILRFAQAHNLLVIEDCAQAYTGDGYWGHPQSDISLFSFGPIKTNTALAGGILQFREPSLRNAVHQQQQQWPLQNQQQFLKRIGKYAFLKFLSYRLTYSLFVRLCSLLKTNHDTVISNSVRGFPGRDFFNKIRQRPSTALLALLNRRLKRVDPSKIAARTKIARTLIAQAPTLKIPGHLAAKHTYWVFPMLCSHPTQLMHYLWRYGFDATQGGSSLYAVEPPANRPELLPIQAQKIFQQLLYLPCYAALSPKDIERLEIALKTYSQQNSDQNPSDSPA